MTENKQRQRLRRNRTNDDMQVTRDTHTATDSTAGQHDHLHKPSTSMGWSPHLQTAKITNFREPYRQSQTSHSATMVGSSFPNL